MNRVEFKLSTRSIKKWIKKKKQKWKICIKNESSVYFVIDELNTLYYAISKDPPEIHKMVSSLNSYLKKKLPIYVRR